MTSKKLAVFVEGQTESIFVKKLLLEVAGQRNISFEVSSANRLTKLSNVDSLDEKKYFVLIVDCRGDDSVKSRILENRDKLIKADYFLVIGLRDVYPVKLNDIAKLEQGLKTGIPTKHLNIEICLAKMEVESWFLEESTHFLRIDDGLTNEKITEGTGFDPSTDNAEDIDCPAELLKRIYQLVGKSYTKKHTQVQRTVDVIDYEEMYFNLPLRLNYFKKFLTHIDSFVS